MEAGVLESDCRPRGDADGEALVIFGEAADRGMTEEQSADRRAGPPLTGTAR